MAVTLDEVSAKAGCSPATVSRVLNNSGPVSLEVKQNVLRVVDEFGYVPPRLRRKAGRMVGQPQNSTSLVEIILHRCTPIEQLAADDRGLHIGPSTKVKGKTIFTSAYRLSADFYMHIISGIMDELGTCGQKAILQVTDDLSSMTLLDDVATPNKRGVILLGEYSDDLTRFVDACQSPLVMVDIIHGGKPDVVTIDNMDGISQAFDHLYHLGHRQIGYVGRPFNKSFAERWTTFQWKMAGAGLTVNPNWVYNGSEHIEDTASGVSRILSGKSRPSAFVCHNDYAAMGVLRAAESRGLSVPGQLSVIGFDDVDGAMTVTPALTTLRVPVQDMGRQAVRQLMIGENFKPMDRGCIIRMPTELVVRQSTAKPQ